MFWLSYGGGVNSTALAILLCEGKLPKYEPWRIVFSDTGDEKPQTYDYIKNVFSAYLAKHGKTLEIVRPTETVLQRWERLKVTGSRQLRGCTVEGKIYPIKRHIEANGGGVQLIGVDAGEDHRMPDRVRPLVDLGIDRDGCEKIIAEAVLTSPGKSGCWHCPFSRVGDVIALARYEPCKFERIATLEKTATETHGRDPNGNPRTQWGDRPADYWRQRASQQDFIEPEFVDMEKSPCECFHT
jgi:hypothetical protein